MRNPRAKWYRMLGLTQSEANDIKAALLAYLDARDDQAEIPDAALRAVHPKLTDDRVWNEARKLVEG